ncbi:MAG: type II toxin-antitoxin system RelE/ParE family toxin, partial [Rhodoplanes sp.]
ILGPRSNLEAIYEYLVSRSPSGARNVMTRINATITLLAEQPAIGYRTENPQAALNLWVNTLT